MLILPKTVFIASKASCQLFVPRLRWFCTLIAALLCGVGASLSAAEATFGMVNGEEQMLSTSGTRHISGVYPHLSTYSQSRKDGRFKPAHEECGIGAVIPWADKLWMVTYAPHKPRGVGPQTVFHR